MSKGETYRAYYQRNRERILTANKERAKSRREDKREMETEEDIIARRQHDREQYSAQKERRIRKQFTDKAKSTETLKSFYETLATATELHTISKKTLDWLLRCVPAPATFPTLVIEEIDGSQIPNADSDSE
jgi:hypothetical protein